MPQVRVRRASYAPLPENVVDYQPTATGTRSRSRTVAAPSGQDAVSRDVEARTRPRSSTTTSAFGNLGRYLGRVPTTNDVASSSGPSMDNSHPLSTILSGTPATELAPHLEHSPESQHEELAPLPATAPLPQRSAAQVHGRARSRTLQSIFGPDETGRARASSVPDASLRPHSPIGARRGSVTSDQGLSVHDIASRDAQEQRMLERYEAGGLGEITEDELHREEVVEHLDVIDPQISTVSHLQNCTNSIMIPHIPSLWSRKPVVTLPETPSDDSLPELETKQPEVQPASAAPSSPTQPSRRSRSQSVSSRSRLSPDDALDRHVEHVLRKRDKFRRALRGLWDFLKTPMGGITAIYGFLVVFWGAAIVLFLLGWIDAGSDYSQKLWIEISSQIVNGLFTITGVGLIPWRAMDTYRIINIWRMKRLTAKLRKARGLPPIEDPDDLPDPELLPDYVFVLTDPQQVRLKHHQEKFKASQTWYRPHATETHRAFPISWALWICLLIDGNSFFQCILCGTMWGLNRFDRPAWTTGCLIPLSFLCGIAASIMIWKGGDRTKKRIQVEKKLREALGMSLVPVGFQLDKEEGPVKHLTAGTQATTDAPQSTSDSGTGHEKDTDDVRRE